VFALVSSMASRAFWSDEELAAIDRHMDRPDWLQRVREVIQGRSTKAIMVRRAKRREELGMADGRRVDGGCTDDDWIADAASASRALLDATLRVGRWT
jgi:hypothetical protein